MPLEEKKNEIKVKAKVNNPAPEHLILDGAATIEVLANNSAPYNGGNKFFIEGEAIRPGTYHASNMDHPINYPQDIMNAIAEQLEGQPIRYRHSEMDKLRNMDLNKIGVVTDTKVTNDGRVLYHGFVSKNKYQLFMSALVDEQHIDPAKIPTFDQFIQLIKDKTLKASSVGLRVDGRWMDGAYRAFNPFVNELSIVPEGACPWSTTNPSDRWGIMALNSAKTPDGQDYLIEANVIYEDGDNHNISDPEPSETTPIDVVGVLAGLARHGIDAVDVSEAKEETLMVIMQYIDAFKAKAFTKLHGTESADNEEVEVETEEVKNEGGTKICLEIKNQTLRKVTLK